jgi:hypothetical protein
MRRRESKTYFYWFRNNIRKKSAIKSLSRDSNEVGVSIQFEFSSEKDYRSNIIDDFISQNGSKEILISVYHIEDMIIDTEIDLLSHHHSDSFHLI